MWGGFPYANGEGKELLLENIRRPYRAALSAGDVGSVLPSCPRVKAHSGTSRGEYGRYLPQKADPKEETRAMKWPGCHWPSQARHRPRHWPGPAARDSKAQACCAERNDRRSTAGSKSRILFAIMAQDDELAKLEAPPPHKTLKTNAEHSETGRSGLLGDARRYGTMSDH
eukprot:scaffold2526_cov130-Isochrysis_galbana.AAC.1